MWKSKLAKSRLLRGTAQPIAAAIASGPTSGLTASDNSQASAAAVAELIKGLDFVFDQLDFENEPGDLLRLHLERLALEAAKYENSRVKADNHEQWTCPRDMGQLLYAASQCSSYIYDPVMQTNADLVPIMTRTPSVTGTEKAACIWKMATTKSLIVSIRGTASAADHMVNLNGQPTDATGFLGLEVGRSVTAHKGFLSCAETLLPIVLKDLIRLVQADSSIRQITFTGHSAGGAVSSLIFLHILHHKIPEIAHVSLGLATFGSPPVTSTNSTATAKDSPQFGFAYAFVNEHDIVSRADSAYISSIIDLYRSRYGLPTAATDGAINASEEMTRVQGQRADAIIEPNNTWKLPPATFQIVGDIVVLRATISTPVVFEAGSSNAPALSTTFEGLNISPDDFSQLLFCEVGVHKRRLYVDRMRAMTASKKPASTFSKAETLVAQYVDQKG
ncbi:lipase (class 3) domain-containing protein [Sarocladium implicatum]|nr:lipase (class 3) domain-containing protein [Sarocladium implicatum]